MTIEGIDISSNNPSYQSIDTAGLSFCIVKASEGTTYYNKDAPAQVVWARSWGAVLGLYHVVTADDDPHKQAMWFQYCVGRLGPYSFWYLDIEPFATHYTVGAWVSTVGAVDLDVATRLGRDRGGWYKGRYFLQTLNGAAAARNWFDPDYRGVGADTSGGVLIHQYTSAGGLDRDKVLNPGQFAVMCGGLTSNDKQKEAKVADMFLMHRPPASTEGHGTGYLVRPGDVTQLGTGTDYSNIRDKGGVSDAGELSDVTVDAILAHAK